MHRCIRCGRQLTHAGADCTSCAALMPLVGPFGDIAPNPVSPPAPRTPAGWPAIAPAPQPPPSGASGNDISGRVREVSLGRADGRPERALGRLAWLLAVPLVIHYVLKHPDLLVGLLCLAIPLFLVLRGQTGRVVSILGLFLPRRHRAESSEPLLSFRVKGDNGATTQVRLRGHDHGVASDDRVLVRGHRVSGVLHATTVVNTDTGATLRRPGLVTLYVLAALNLYLAASLLALVIR